MAKNKQLPKLTIILKQNLPQLRNIFLQDWPKHIIGHDLINNYIHWFEIEPNYSDALIYSIDDDWQDGTFIILDKHALFVYSLNDDLEKLSTMIQLIPRDRPYLCSTILKKHSPALTDAFGKMNFQKDSELATLLYMLPKSVGKNFKINTPAGVQLKKLIMENIAQVNAIYPFHSRDTSRQFFNYVKYNINWGAFDEETGELMAWCLRHQSGLLTALQVEKQFMRRGLGELVVKAMVKEISDDGDDCTVCIVVENIPSRKLFEKVGFKDTEVEVVWFDYSPKELQGTGC